MSPLSRFLAFSFTWGWVGERVGFLIIITGKEVGGGGTCFSVDYSIRCCPQNKVDLFIHYCKVQ